VKPSDVLLRFCLCVIVLAALSVASFAQATEAAAAANAAYQQKECVTAARLYGELAQSSPKNPRFWYRLGVSQRATGQNEQALQSFPKAQVNGLPLALGGLEIASAYTTLGQ